MYLRMYLCTSTLLVCCYSIYK